MTQICYIFVLLQFLLGFLPALALHDCGFVKFATLTFGIFAILASGHFGVAENLLANFLYLRLDWSPPFLVICACVAVPIWRPKMQSRRTWRRILYIIGVTYFEETRLAINRTQPLKDNLKSRVKMCGLPNRIVSSMSLRIFQHLRVISYLKRKSFISFAV